MYFKSDVSSFVKSGYSVKAYEITTAKWIYAENIGGESLTEKYLKFVKIAHTHFERWGNDFGVLVTEAEKTARALNKKPAFTNDMAMSLIGKYNHMFEEAVIKGHQRIIMPYANLKFQANGNIDLNNSNPYVFGIMYEYEDW